MSGVGQDLQQMWREKSLFSGLQQTQAPAAMQETETRKRIDSRDANMVHVQ